MAKQAKKQPNILIMMLDTQSAYNMSCYGYRLKTTPHIDQLGREGAVFENHFVTGGWTLPVHASIWTGRYESGHGAGAQHECLSPGIPMMPEIFKKAGYRTVIIASNKYCYDPTPPATAWGFDEHIEDWQVPAVEPYVPLPEEQRQGKDNRKFVGTAVDWIVKHQKKNPSQPFLMFINIGLTHDVYRAPEPFRSRFLPEGVRYDPEKHAPKGWQCLGTTGDVCPTLEQWQIQRALYDACAAAQDEGVGMLINDLRQRRILDETIFMVTGDHGDTQGEQIRHAYHSQNGIWERQTKTPLVVRYPGAFKPKTRCKEIVQCCDILPGLMDLCGIEDEEARASIQGESFMKALRGPVREFALIEAQRAIHPMRRAWIESPSAEDLDIRYMNVWQKAARTKRYKYIWVSDGNDMLFDIVKDPEERWNIIKQKPEIAKKLMKAMEEKLMSMEQRYYMDYSRVGPQNGHRPYAHRRLAAWGLYQPGIVEAWDPDKKEPKVKPKLWPKGKEPKYFM